MNFILNLVIVATIFVDKCLAVPIIGGEGAAEEVFTYQVAIYSRKDGTISLCSGAIIDAAHVLTAAHCVTKTTKDMLSVVAGITFRSDPEGFYYTVKEIHTPEGYPGVRQVVSAYDIAVVVINGLFDNDPSISVIPIPREPFQIGEECIYSGWGDIDDNGNVPDILQWSTGTLLSHDSCRRFSDIHRSYELCFLHNHYQSAIHDGDSGAPLVCHGVLTGIMTRGGGSTFITSTGIDIYRFREFIIEITDKFICDLSLEQY